VILNYCRYRLLHQYRSTSLISLIGGPNQSHKVNFKELPTRGKVWNENLGHSFVNPFSRKSSQNIPGTVFRKNLGLAPRTASLSIFSLQAAIGGLKKNSAVSSVNTFPGDFLEKISPATRLMHRAPAGPPKHPVFTATTAEGGGRKMHWTGCHSRNFSGLLTTAALPLNASTKLRIPARSLRS
jgi:hypothetical protein